MASVAYSLSMLQRCLIAEWTLVSKAHLGPCLFTSTKI